MTKRRNSGSGITCRIGEAGCSRITVTKLAEIIKIPRLAASIRYSGQCRLKVFVTQSFRGYEEFYAVVPTRSGGSNAEFCQAEHRTSRLLPVSIEPI